MQPLNAEQKELLLEHIRLADSVYDLKQVLTALMLLL